MRFERTGLGAALALALLSPLAVGQEHEHGGGSAERLGTVRFDTSCSAPAQAQVNHAVAWLHSFEFGPAIAAFEDAGRMDPTCGIAYWGVALASWGNPFAAGAKAPAQIARGQDAIDQGTRAGAKSERERAYIAAVAELYRDAAHRDQRARVLAYRDATATLASRHPEDMEARVFYALALAQSVAPTDKTYDDLLKAGAILEELFAKYPDHPGLAHYIIHSYDVPPLAARALDAARRYAQIAPSAPHALHMPSHTFTRLGYWQDSIDANIASAAAAKRDGVTAEELHASDYLMYAYLQTGQDAAARRLRDSLPEIAALFDPEAVGSAAPGVAGVFALAAIPARWAIERRAWAEAAQLSAHRSRFPHTEAMTWFAQSLGASRVGEVAAARTALDALVQIRDRLTAAHEGYWAGQVEIQWRMAGASIAWAEGRKAEALEGMRAAAALEDGTEKNAITPGPIVPARELLGELLLEGHEPQSALREFRATLQKEPDRYRALAGAARAAALAGDQATAATYYARLLKTCERADRPGRSELVEARAFANTVPGNTTSEMQMEDRQVSALTEMMEAVNAGDAARYARVYAEDAVITIHGGGELRGRVAIEQYEVELLREFPGARLAFSDVWQKGPLAVVHYAVNGQAPGGPSMGHEGLLFYRFHPSGLVAEERRYLDTLTPMAQMGLFGTAPARSLPTLSKAMRAHVAKGAPDENGNVAMVTATVAALDARNEPAFLARVAEDAVLDELILPEPFLGKQKVKTWFETWTAALPDARSEITTILGADEFVLVEAVVRGTLRGPLGRISASNKELALHRAAVFEVKERKLVRILAFMNGKELAQAAGQWPPVLAGK